MNKLATLVLAGELLAGVNGIAHAPEIGAPFRQPTSKEIAQIDKKNFVDPAFEKSAKLAAKVGYEVALDNEAYTERQDRMNSDPIYNLVVQVYDSVKDSFKIPSYMTPEFFRAMINTESTNYRFAVSSAGAMGYTQMTPAAAAEVGVSDNFENHAFNAWDSINMSMAYFTFIDKYLSSNYPRWDQTSNFHKLRDDSDAYNMGYGGFLKRSLDENGNFTEKNLPEETFHYFRKIMRYWKLEFPKSFEEFMNKNSPGNPEIYKEYILPAPFLREADSSRSSQDGSLL